MPIPLYSLTYEPTPNITPFTYRDGLTYLEQLELINQYIDNTLVPTINALNQQLTDLTQVVEELPDGGTGGNEDIDGGTPDNDGEGTIDGGTP